MVGFVGSLGSSGSSVLPAIRPITQAIHPSTYHPISNGEVADISDDMAGIGRFVLWLGLAVWTVVFLRMPLGEISSSILHMVNLPFHEAGHLLFAPFGDFMMSLGGSLLQVIVPLVCAGRLSETAGRSLCSIGLRLVGRPEPARSRSLHRRCTLAAADAAGRPCRRGGRT